MSTQPWVLRQVISHLKWMKLPEYHRLYLACSACLIPAPLPPQAFRTKPYDELCASMLIFTAKWSHGHPAQIHLLEASKYTWGE